MTHDLPDLPIEILIVVVESVDGKHSRLEFCEALRLTCKELDRKLVRYYGVHFYKRIQVLLNESDFTRLSQLSQRPLAEHVESLTIDCGPFVLQHKPVWQGILAKYVESLTIDCDQSVLQHKPAAALIDDNIDLSLKGCTEILVSSLEGLPHLSEYQVMHTHISPSDLCGALTHCWTKTVTTLFRTVLSRSRRLRMLATPPALGHSLYTQSSILSELVGYPVQLIALTKFGINIDTTRTPFVAEYPAFWEILNASSRLDDFHFGCSGSYGSFRYFNYICSHMNRPGFRRLSLSGLVLLVSTLTTFLRSKQGTLEVLVLDRIQGDEASEKLDIFLSTCFMLKAITLRFINFGRYGLAFWNVSQQRPMCKDITDVSPEEESDWVWTEEYNGDGYELALNKEEGDDIRYWLGYVAAENKWGNAWNWLDVVEAD